MNTAKRSEHKSRDLAQFRNAIVKFSNLRITRGILFKKIDINHMFPDDLSESKSKLCTALHLASTKKSLENFELLLNSGADMTIKDSDGLTCLHRIIRDRYSSDIHECPIDPFISLVLSAHVKSSISVNPCDEYGLTHFHVACMMNDALAVDFFLHNSAPVDQAVNADSPFFPGFTPLHFAARFNSLETAKLLVKHGANAKIKDARGINPLHVLIERKIAMLDMIDVEKNSSRVEDLQGRICDNEKILHLLLDKVHHNCADEIGFSKCQAICTLQNYPTLASISEQITDVDARISLDSPFYPGYTLLHFAAHCNLSLVKLLLELGANIEAKDAKGLTPFDICIKWCKIEETHAIICMVPSWANIVFAGGNTTLVECIAAMECVDSFVNFLRTIDDVNMCLPSDSPLWPGSSVLHLTVVLGKQTEHLVRMCLYAGMSITLQDVEGRTPLNLAYRLNNRSVVKLLLEDCKNNSIDRENLSHLHIACAENNRWLLETLPVNDVDLNAAYEGRSCLHNLKPGWTSLHVAVWNDADCEVPMSSTEILLGRGANKLRVDENSFTPVHLLLAKPRIDSVIATSLLSRIDTRENDVSNVGLTHLHVASFFNNVEAAKKLIDFGSNIDAVTSFSRFHNLTPLHVAMMRHSPDVVNLLVKRGADVLAKKPNGSTPLSEVLTLPKHSRSLNSFVDVLRKNEALRQRLEAELGLTMLHVVCHARHVDAMKNLLENGADVNAKINDDSPFWPGWTPLHVLVAVAVQDARQTQSDFKAMLDLLLSYGAIITLANAEGDTAVHLTMKKDVTVTGYCMMGWLLNAQKDFGINPINKDGVTHFHVACLANNLEAAEKYLIHDGIDVNQPIDFFAEPYAGSTPLHLALNSNSKRYFGIERHLQMLDLLLKYEPDLNAEDDHGYTPLHVAADCDPSCVSLWKRLLDNGAEINAKTIDGKTAFEMLLRSKEVSVEDVQFFVEHHFPINGCNPVTDVGYMSIILDEKDRNLRSSIVKAMISAPCITELDEMGRSAIHNVVATNDSVISESEYRQLINKLVRLGCDINEQDKSGMTALHLAARFRNKNATEGLLISGADINIIDIRGKSAFFYVHDTCTRYITRGPSPSVDLLRIFAKHVLTLQVVGLFVSQLNDEQKILALKHVWVMAHPSCADSLLNVELVSKNLQEAKNTQIGARGLTLGDFFKEHGVVNTYRTFSKEDRATIDKFFETIDYHRFFELRYLLTLQYRQAVTRHPLIEPAMVALRNLIGFPLPDLCAEVILGYLRNPDLKHLIAAANNHEDNFMLID